MGSIEPEADADASTHTTPGAAAGPGTAQRASGNSAEAVSSEPITADGLRFELLRNAAYHADRLSFFEGCHRMVMFLSALSGTAAAGAALKDGGGWGVLFGLIVAGLTTFDLVLNLTARARHHETMRQRTFALLGDLEEAPAETANVARIYAGLVRLYGEESADMWAVNAMAWNTAYCALHREVPDGALIEIGLRRRLLRNILPLPGQYLTGREIAARKREGGKVG